MHLDVLVGMEGGGGLKFFTLLTVPEGNIVTT